MPNTYTLSTRRTIRRSVCFLAFCFVLLAGLLRFNTYRQNVDQAERHTLENLSTIAWTASQAIDGDRHQRLVERYSEMDAIQSNDDDVDYAALHAALENVAANTGTHSPIYTYVLNDGAEGDHDIEFIATSAVNPYFRHRFTTLQDNQLIAFGEAGVLPVYKDAIGTWLSAFAPVRNRKGDIVAMVQADEKFDTFIAEARAAALKGIGYDLAFLVGLIAVVGIFVTKMLTREQRDKEALAEAVAVQTQLSETIAEREAELARNASMLEQSNRDLTDFANIASHDLKSPLRGIASFAQLLARRNRATLDDSSNEYLDFIISNSNRAIKLVNGLLSYAKADQGERPPEKFKACEAIHAAEQNLYATLQERHARLRINGTMPFINADLTLVTQVFQNLISNGIKYNEDSNPEVQIEVLTAPNGDTVFGVRDNGIGIPEEYQAYVFDMFRRVHAGDQYEGSGIGLAFCMRVVNRYEGTMWVESTPEVGSTFYFTLPAAACVEEELVGV